MAFYPRPWSPTLLIESRCANQPWRAPVVLSLLVRGLAFGCAAPRCWSKPPGAPVPIDAQSAAPERVWELQIALPRELPAVWQSTPRLALVHDVGSLTQCSFQFAELSRDLADLCEQVVLGGLDVFDVRCQEALSDCSNKECGRADANQHDDDGDDLALGCLWRDVAADGGHGGDGPIEAVPKRRCLPLRRNPLRRP